MDDMKPTIVDGVALLAILRADPYFAYIISAIPAIMVCLFGGLTEVVSGSAEVSMRSIGGAFCACIMTGVVMTHLINELEIKTGWAIVMLIFAGYSSRPLLDRLATIIVKRIANLLKGDF